MVSNAKVEAQISKAEIVFTDCWATLARLRGATKGNRVAVADIFSLQPKLARAMFQLTSFYNAVSGERRVVCGRRGYWKPKAFKRRVEKLEHYKTAIGQAIDVGKAVGDAFAWMFYQNDRDLLRRHSEHSGPPHMPTGVGGQAEIAFIEKLQKFGSYLVLLHSITSFLRLGDVTLVNPQTLRVAAVGELKSQRNSSTEVAIRIALLFRSKDELLLPKSSLPAPLEPTVVAVSADAEERFKRQLKRIGEAMKDEQVNCAPLQKLIATFDYEKVNSAYQRTTRRRFGVVKLSQGLGAVHCRLAGGSLAHRLLRGQTAGLDENASEVMALCKELVDKTISDNSIRLSWLVTKPGERYNLLPGMKPVFWWELPIELREAIVFRKVAVMTIYNPAFLIADLRRRGLTVVTGSNGLIEISKHDGRAVKFEGTPYLLAAIQKYLFPETTVASIVERLSNATALVPPGYATARIHLDLHWE